MGKPDSTSGSGGYDVFNTVFIDTSLDTHLAMIVSDSDTVSDLKKKILYEHPLCFPNIGKIKITALKVKRKGYLYHLSDSMFVKSAFGGVSKSWFLSVDASSAKECRENHNSSKPDIGNVGACFRITTNNSSADVVDLLPGGTSKRLSDINGASLAQDGDNCHAKLNSASQQLGFSNSTKENSEDLHKEAEHTADSISRVLFPATSKDSRPKVQSKDVGGDKICEDLPASVAASVLEEKPKTKKRNKDAILDHDLKENSAFVVVSGKDTLDSGNVCKENSFQNGLNVVSNNMNLVNQICVDETCGSLSADRNKKSAARKRMADEGTKVPGENSECETNKHRDVSLSRGDQEYKSKENSLQSGPASKKKRKAEKKDGVLVSDFVKQGTGPDAETSKCSVGQNPENKSAILDNLNTESVKENRSLTANANGGSKKRKKKKSNPNQVGSEVFPAKDVNVDTFQATEAVKHKDLGSEADPQSVLGKSSTGVAISEPCLISSKEMQEVSKTNRVTHLEGDDDMAGTNDGKVESRNEAPEPDVGSVIKTRDSYHQNSSHVDGHSTPVSQKAMNLQNDNGVSGQQKQGDTLEDKILEPKKSSKKRKKCKKTKDPVGRKKCKKTKDAVGGTKAVHDGGPAGDISPAERPTFVNGDHSNDNAQQGGTTDEKEESKMQKSDCSPTVTDVRADDVIHDVLESLQQCNNVSANAENMGKKSRKKMKKRSPIVVDLRESQGKDDVDHRDLTVLVDNVSEVSASSNSTRNNVKVNSSSAVQLNGLDLGSKYNTGVGISPENMQLDSSQSTRKPNSDGRPIQDVSSGDHPKDTRVDNANNSIEVPCGGESVQSQQITEKKGVEAEMKGKKNKMPEVKSGRSKPKLSSSEMLNGNRHKAAKAAKSSSKQSQRSSSEVEPDGFNLKSSKPLLTISESAAKEPVQPSKSDKINSITKNAQRPIDINSSRAYKDLQKNNAHSVSSSPLETSRNNINLNKGGNEHRSRLDIAKDTGSNSGKVVNNLANNKSLLDTAGTIFRHNGEESSDDDGGLDNSDFSVQTPSDSSASSDYSDDSHANGSCNLEGEEAGGRIKQKSGSSSPKNVSLHAILRNSSSYKKAKLTASQELDNQPDEFVPDSQAT